jgi:hypothetical protein
MSIGTTQKKRHRSKKMLWLAVCVESIVLLALIIGVIVAVTRNPLEGTWYAGDQLTYKFGSKGKGVQVLDGDLARFDYKISGKTVTIDFYSAEIPDRTYHFSVEDDILILDDETGNEPEQYQRMK